MQDNLKSFLQLIKGLPSREEFVKAFGVVTERHKKFEDSTVKTLADFHAKVHKKIDDRLAQIKDGKDAKPVDEKALADKIQKRIRVPKDGKTPTKGVDYFDGEPGLPGKDATVDEDKIVESVLAKIPEPKAGKDGKIIPGWGAHPIQIFNTSGTLIDEVARNIKFGTNLTTTRSPDGVITVTASGGVGTIYTETLTDSGDHQNFTALHTITTVFLLATLSGQYIASGNYSVSGNTVTLSAPDAGAAANGIEIKYA